MNPTDLAGASLDCAVFDGATMNSVRLGGAHLAGARFRADTMNRVDFKNATLLGAVFESSTPNFAGFSGAGLRGADLRGARLNRTTWTGATCPDGAHADAAGCEGHLTPLPTGTTGATRTGSDVRPKRLREPAPWHELPGPFGGGGGI